MKPYDSSEEMYNDMEYKVESLTYVLRELLNAVDWDDVQEVGGKPLEKAIEKANAVLDEIDSESNEFVLEAFPRTVVCTLQDGDITQTMTQSLTHRVTMTT
jgi:hypothetical protein